MNPEIKIKLLPGGRMPERAHPTDACFDVFAVSRQVQDGYVSYGLGFATELPEGWAGYLYPRSSISKYDLVLCNSVGVVDAGYRGEWQARFRLALPILKLTSFGADPIAYATAGNPANNVYKVYEVGDRIGQIRFAPLPAYSLVQADELNDTPRGAGGFGSTGSK